MIGVLSLTLTHFSFVGWRANATKGSLTVDTSASV